MRSVLLGLTMASLALGCPPATALPLVDDNGIVDGELASLHRRCTFPCAPVLTEYAREIMTTLWVTSADAGSWPVCWFALALMLHELVCVHAAGRNPDNGALDTGT